MDDQLEYFHFDKDVKCKIIVLTLTRIIMNIFKSLLDKWIDSWRDFYEVFTT